MQARCAESESPAARRVTLLDCEAVGDGTANDTGAVLAALEINTSLTKAVALWSTHGRIGRCCIFLGASNVTISGPGAKFVVPARASGRLRGAGPSFWPARYKNAGERGHCLLMLGRSNGVFVSVPARQLRNHSPPLRFDLIPSISVAQILQVLLQLHQGHCWFATPRARLVKLELLQPSQACVYRSNT